MVTLFKNIFQPKNYKKFFFSFIVLFSSIIFFVSFRIYSIQEQYRIEMKDAEWTRDLELYLSYLKDAETAERGYILSGKEVFLAPYYDAISKFSRLELNLRSGVPPQLRSQLEELFLYSNEKKAFLLELIELVKNKKNNEASVRFNSQRGRELMDVIRIKVSLILNEKMKMDKDFKKQSEIQNVIAFSFSLFGFIFILFILYWMILIISENSKINQDRESIFKKFEEIDDLFQNSPVGFHSLDTNGLYLKINKMGQRWLGYDESDLIGKKKFIELLTEKSRVEFQNNFPIFKKLGAIESLRFELIKKNGEILNILLSATAINDTSGNFLMTRSTFVDITESIKYEKNLLEAKRKAEEASIAKSEFLSSMSHEIRTPMNAVIGFANLLLDESPMPEHIEYLNNLKFSSETLLALINDILDFNKIEQRKVLIEEIPFRIDLLLNSVIGSFSQKCNEKMINLKTDIADNFPKVIKGDPTRILQILNNLLSNAVKFTQVGSIYLKAVLISSTDEKYTIQFRVEDSGIGIPDSKLDSIFDKFTQVGSDTTRRYGGSGLGLAIAKGLVELMGGSIIVSSHVGSGTTFTFTINVLKSNESLEGTISVNSGKFERMPGLRVLIADDIQINREIVSKFLIKWGIEVSHAENGMDVLSKIKEFEYDLILMDLHMPELDGYQTTIKIREGTLQNQIPIIALTASVEIQTQERIKEIGMNDFISKPFIPADLHQKIYKIFNKQ